jgi:hypothetical protein
MKQKMILTVILAMILQISAESIVENFDGSAPRNLNHFNFDGGGSKVEWQTKIEDGILKIAMNPEDEAGAWQGPNYAAKKLSHFGRYSARIKIPSTEAQPNVGAVVGFYTYYNDEWGTELPKDENGNGVYDNSEIDFEWLIADPQIIYLTAWTDYQDFPDGTTRFGKVGRIINMATGTIISTEYAETWGANVTLTGVENQPATIRAITNYDASKNFYTYGFDWKSDNIRWWIINPEDETDTITLWDYKGPKERITQKPARLSFNIWHTHNWPVVTKPNSIEKPIEIFWAEFDWIKYEKFEDIPTSIKNERKNNPKNNKRSQAKILSVQKSSKQTTIKFDQLKNAEISIFSPNGRRLFHSQITNSEISVPNFQFKTILQITQNGSTIYKAVW